MSSFSLVDNGIDHKKYYRVMNLHRFKEYSFSSENIFPNLVFELMLYPVSDTMSDKLDTCLGKNAKNTRVVPKVMSNFFFCMRTGNSRRRRVWW